MEILNALLQQADALGILASIPCHSVRLRTSMYADDVVIFVCPLPQDLNCIRATVDCFGDALGLRTNFDKCSLSPIHFLPDHMVVATLHFPCAVQHFPCTYLELSLSYKRVSRACLQPLLDRVFRKLPPWITGMIYQLVGSSSSNRRSPRFWSTMPSRCSSRHGWCSPLRTASMPSSGRAPTPSREVTASLHGSRYAARWNRAASASSISSFWGSPFGLAGCDNYRLVIHVGRARTRPLSPRSRGFSTHP